MTLYMHCNRVGSSTQPEAAKPRPTQRAVEGDHALNNTLLPLVCQEGRNGEHNGNHYNDYNGLYRDYYKDPFLHS